MDRRNFLAALAALPVAVKVFAQAEPAKDAAPVFRMPDGALRSYPGCVVALAIEPLKRGQLVVWDRTVLGHPYVRVASTYRDFEEHVRVGQAAVATCSVPAWQHTIVRVKGEAMILAGGVL